MVQHVDAILDDKCQFPGQVDELLPDPCQDEVSEESDCEDPVDGVLPRLHFYWQSLQRQIQSDQIQSRRQDETHRADVWIVVPGVDAFVSVKEDAVHIVAYPGEEDAREIGSEAVTGDEFVNNEPFQF